MLPAAKAKDQFRICLFSEWFFQIRKNVRASKNPVTGLIVDKMYEESTQFLPPYGASRRYNPWGVKKQKCVVSDYRTPPLSTNGVVNCRVVGSAPRLIRSDEASARSFSFVAALYRGYEVEEERNTFSSRTRTA